jgi:hypothetical protein
MSLTALLDNMINVGLLSGQCQALYLLKVDLFLAGVIVSRSRHYRKHYLLGHRSESLYKDYGQSHSRGRLVPHYFKKTLFDESYRTGSTWHVIEYDAKTGVAVGKHTAQGYSDSSTWARGQSWGIYGFANGAYRTFPVRVQLNVNLISPR